LWYDWRIKGEVAPAEELGTTKDQTMPTETQTLATTHTATVEGALDEIRRRFKGSPLSGGVTAVKHLPAREAELVPFPADLAPKLAEILTARGIERLYSHQGDVFRLVREGKNPVVVTPTASGKTLCYNLPILDALVRNPDARAMYLFPTKALSQDQLTELNRWTAELGDEIRTFTYDGDTPQDARKAIRARGNLVITNPDMLHAGILPHHTKWERLFENLQYVVIDELHYYRGVLGSHLANVLRRLKRIAQFYGSRPQFICASATIANPAELAARILEEDVALVDRNGAPSCDKYLVFYNPPVVNPQLGIRRSYLNESRRMARTFLERGLETIVFANSRLATEILVTYLKGDFARGPAGPDVVRGYRGGYLPLERREIERDLREGRLLGVVATNALELGIDIGSLDVAVLAGYPGTIASTWQRAGRAGRRQGTSAAVMVASSAPLDQFMVQNPDYFFGRSPEHGYVNPDNLEILLNHLKCAVFELPITEEERFGALDLRVLCRHLAETGFLHHTGGAWHWVSESYPADAVSLRSVSSDNFVIVDNTAEPRVLGEVDFPSALTTLHEKAIYIQNGEQYHVERLDYDDRKAYVHRVDSDYYTDAISYTKITVLETFESSGLGARGPGFAADETRNPKLETREGPDFEPRTPNTEHRVPSPEPRTPTKNHGEVHVNTQVVGFKKIKFHTHENVGAGNLTLPEQEMHTTAWWLTLPHEILETLPYSSTDRQDGVRALGNALQAMAILLVMCDGRDLGVAVGENSRSQESGVTSQRPEERSQSSVVSRQLSVEAGEHSQESKIGNQGSDRTQRTTDNGPRTAFEPNIYLYDKYPGGIGLSEPLYRMSGQLVDNARKLIENCPCEAGCPSCVGPVGEIGEKGKDVALAILGSGCGVAYARQCR
jgi:DEAD/DEAH box helicase domain-containing protein